MSACICGMTEPSVAPAPASGRAAAAPSGFWMKNGLFQLYGFELSG